MAHPRTRGEHSRTGTFTPTAGGSSPHARGTPRAQARHGSHSGLIPARAGNTCRRCVSWSDRRAHPRTRGEHLFWLILGQIAVGSSPHARGTPSTVRIDLISGGLIPARAGNTRKVATPRETPTAHPRTRGEHPLKILRTNHVKDRSRPGAQPKPMPVERPKAVRSRKRVGGQRHDEARPRTHVRPARADGLRSHSCRSARSGRSNWTRYGPPCAR